MWLLIAILVLVVLSSIISRIFPYEPKNEEEQPVYYEPIVQIEYFNPYWFDKATYLQSAEWQALRNQVLLRDHHTCCKCGLSPSSLDIHHIRYDHLGKEPLEDLVSLCRKCHQEVHDKYGYDLNREFPIT